MKLELKEIEQIANLARLYLSDNEKIRYADQLSTVFDYFEMLNEVNTDNVAETCQVTGLSNVIRRDVPKNQSAETRDLLINSFPEKFQDLLRVRAVFGDDK